MDTCRVGLSSRTILNATVLEVVFAAGFIGIYMDSFAEKQLLRLRSLSTIGSRRRSRVRVDW